MLFFHRIESFEGVSLQIKSTFFISATLVCTVTYSGTLPLKLRIIYFHPALKIFKIPKITLDCLFAKLKVSKIFQEDLTEKS